jgi:preprotein translocase SecE subunit
MAFITFPGTLVNQKGGAKKCGNFSLKNRKLSRNSPNFLKFCKADNSDEKNQNIEKEGENDQSIFSFFKETLTEMNMIEWPSLDRLFKQFVIVVISLVFSAVFIYSVDGIFASMSKFLFEGN